MRIAVNVRLLLAGKLEGIGWFTFETLQRITRQHPEHEFLFLFDRPFDPQFIFADNITPLVIPPPTRHPVLWYLWFEGQLPRILKKHKADLLLLPDAFGSLRCPVPFVSVIHDINFEHYPKALAKSHSWFYRKFTPRYAHAARRVATVSEASKQDLVTSYGVAADKIDVVYNGVNPRYQPIDPKAIAATRDKYSAGVPYFLFIGSLHPRKNLARLFQAFDRFRANTSGKEKLLIVGVPKWWTGEMRGAYESMRFKEEVIFAGHLEPGELHQVIASALAMVYVSYFEGFGIPILEGFQCRVPVLTSNLSSMPEVAGGAARLVDPFSVADIARGLEELAQDPELRQQLIALGEQRVKDFSWQATADRLWNCLQTAIHA
ncbi:MAG: glycosyltransferase family 4 protein [Salibacteraceae bacterium]